MRLYLIRHALTATSGPDARLWSLAPEGERQARDLVAAAFWGDVSLVVSSPEAKALETVRPAAERHRLRVETDDRLAEVRRPARWIPEYDDAVARYLDGPDEPPQGWEPRAEAAGRAAACVAELQARGGEAPMAVCSHGLLLTLLLGTLPGERGTPSVLWRSVGFCAVAVVEDNRLVRPFGPPSSA